jgi:hypothetical protein
MYIYTIIKTIKMKNILNYILSVLGIKTQNTNNNIYYNNKGYYVGDTKLRTITDDALLNLFNIKRTRGGDDACVVCGKNTEIYYSGKHLHNFTGHCEFLHPEDDKLFSNADNYELDSGEFEIDGGNYNDLGHHEVCSNCVSKMEALNLDEYLTLG